MKARRHGINVMQSEEDILGGREAALDADYDAELADDVENAFADYGVDNMGRDGGYESADDPWVEVNAPQDTLEGELHALLSSQSFNDDLRKTIGPATVSEEEYTRKQYLRCKTIVNRLSETDKQFYIQSG